MATRTLVQLIADVRSRCAIINSGFVDDTTELTPWINNAVGELYDLVIATYEHYYLRFFSFSLTGGFSGNSQALSGLTGGFYKDNTLERNPGVSNFAIVDRLGAFNERSAVRGLKYEIIDTPPTLYVYPPEMSAGNYRLAYTPDPPILATAAPGPQVDLDTTLTRWYMYVVMRAQIDVFRKRGKTDEATMLAGDPNNPQPGTLAHEKQRVQSMARNKMEGPQQVPLQQRRTTFWNGDDIP